MMKEISFLKKFRLSKILWVSFNWLERVIQYFYEFGMLRT